ncbi:MAG: carbonic anhydrase [Bacteroidetes bacterium]|nr:carbonic anhydrase [Bacteroidota bacterium]
MDQYMKIFENNKAWVQSKLASDEHFFENLEIDQKPQFLYIGCSDSRVPANVIMGLDEGEVFVHRNIANLVVSTDNNINAVIQYAVEHLNIQHIIVCGHYGCGGVKAALHPTDMGQLNSWLQTLRDVYRIHQEELDGIDDPHKKFDRLVELNVVEQCVNIVKIDHVQRKWYKTGFPKIHAWVYDLHNGLLKELPVDLKEFFSSIRSIYDLKIDNENIQV